MKIKLQYAPISLLAVALTNKTFAQPTIEESTPDYYYTYFGFGIGREYGDGAIGIRAIIDPAFNVGVSAKLIPYGKFCSTLTAMYGYNAVIQDKNFYETTLAISKVNIVYL